MAEAQYSLDNLITLMQRLRNPETGCPWDIEQSYRSITPSTIEEVYEVVEAIDNDDIPALKEELGDLLFQIIFYCQLGSEESDESMRFSIADIIHNLTTKLIRRHPHVFADGTLNSLPPEKTLQGEQQVKAQWEAIKQEERKNKGQQGLFDDIPVALPAINRAAKIQKRASSIGFDWNHATPVIAKLHEEINELEQAQNADDTQQIHEEVGDILFTAINLARKCSVNPEHALRDATKKFETRLKGMEAELKQAGKTLEETSSDILEQYWQQIKKSKAH